jgi:hypothetical protein
VDTLLRKSCLGLVSAETISAYGGYRQQQPQKVVRTSVIALCGTPTIEDESSAGAENCLPPTPNS